MSQTIGAVLSTASRIGTQREFETTMILRPETGKQAIGALVAKLQAILVREGARLQKIDNWGVRTLAYPVRRNTKGIYLYMRFLAGSSAVPELERNLRIFDDVIRYLTVRIDENVDPNARPSEITSEQLENATETAEDPLDSMSEQELHSPYGSDSGDDDDDYGGDGPGDGEG